MSRYLFPIRRARPRLYAYWSPDVGTGALPEESEFITIYPGWNVWDVWQVNSLPFSLLMVGVSRDRQLRIWVEDKVRLGAPGSLVADSIDLKGGQIEVLNGKPVGLTTDQRKEQVPGPIMVVDGPATLRTVRFFNRGGKAKMAWPHDNSYLLDQNYIPAPSNPATTGPAPDTIGSTVGSGVVAPITDLLSGIPLAAYGGAAVFAAFYVFRKELFSHAVSRARQSRHSRNRHSKST
jgi:hypothetical protein